VAAEELQGRLELPVLSKKKAVTDIDLEFSPNFRSIEQPALPRNWLKQYGGMIDAGRLVQEKSHILEKKVTNTTRTELFPMGHMDLRRLKRTHLEDPMKLKASPAHSHRFMENMLLKALKRAGYDEEKVEQPKPELRSVSLRQGPQLCRSLAHHRRKSSRGDGGAVLVNSAFDDCYFTKI
jgi:hypothetical protein